MTFKTLRLKRTILSLLAQQLLTVAITMPITTSRYSSPLTLHGCAKHFLPKILNNFSAWKVNQDCLTNLLKAFNQGGFVAQLARYNSYLSSTIRSSSADTHNLDTVTRDMARTRSML